MVKTIISILAILSCLLMAHAYDAWDNARYAAEDNGGWTMGSGGYLERPVQAPYHDQWAQSVTDNFFSDKTDSKNYNFEDRWQGWYN